MPQPVLATAGIAFVLIVFACVVYFAARALGAGGKKNKDAGLELLPEPQLEALSRLRSQYEEIYKAANVPNNAMILRLVTNSYIPAGASARHYCWVQNSVMHMFPLWESIAAANAADPTPREWKIPISDIICFATEQGLPNKFVVLQFKIDSEVMTLSFGEEAARIFSAMIPKKDFSQLIEELYPKSSRNIYDIRESFQSLKELREEDLITEDEYAAKKKEMLILM